MARTVPIPIAIIIIIVCVFLVGGLIFWQCLKIPKEEEIVSKIAPEDETAFICNNNSDCVKKKGQCAIECLYKDQEPKYDNTIECEFMPWPTSESCECINNRCTKFPAKEQACINTGGMVKATMCCKKEDDFPNLCLIESCSCSLENSHEVNICDCGEGRCFDGKECVLIFVEHEEEITDWETYRNEEYGLEFEYPKNWGDITFETKKTSEIYNFTSQNEKIRIISYYKPSGTLAFIITGEKYAYLPNGEKNYQRILKVIQPNKEIKTIYTVSPELLGFYGGLGLNINFNGEYIVFVIGAWEWCESFLANTTATKLIRLLEDYNIWFCDVFEPVYWSSDNKTLAIRSYINFFAGSGTEGIFVSDYGDSEKLNKIFTLTEEEIEGESYFYDLYFIDNDRFSFSVFSRKFDQEKIEYYGEKRTIYEYNVKTKELKEVD